MVDDPLGELLANSYKKMADEHAELLEGVKSLKSYLDHIGVVLAGEHRGTVALESYVAGAGGMANELIAKVERPVSDR